MGRGVQKSYNWIEPKQYFFLVLQKIYTSEMGAGAEEEINQRGKMNNFDFFQIKMLFCVALMVSLQVHNPLQCASHCFPIWTPMDLIYRPVDPKYAVLLLSSQATFYILSLSYKRL